MGWEKSVTTQQERWLPVPGYEGFYEISDFGRVRSLDRVVGPFAGKHGTSRYHTVHGRILTLGNDIYPRVWLRRDGVGKQARVHVLVLAAFVGPRPAGQVVRHLNGIPNDNRLKNLTYGTRSENAKDALRHGVIFCAALDRCKRNHEFTPENSFIRKNSGRRGCRKCHRIHNRARKRGLSTADYEKMLAERVAS